MNLKSTDPIDSSTEPAPDPVKPSEEQKQPEEQKTPEQKQPEKAEAQTPVVVNTVLKPAQPVFEVHTSTNTPVTISGNSIQIQGGDNNSETVVSTVSGNPAGTASGAIPGGTPAGAAGNAAGSAGSAPEAGKADRPLPVTADESDNGMWFLILASVCCLIPAILYSILQSVPARESR